MKGFGLELRPSEILRGVNWSMRCESRPAHGRSISSRCFENPRGGASVPASRVRIVLISWLEPARWDARPTTELIKSATPIQLSARALYDSCPRSAIPTSFFYLPPLREPILKDTLPRKHTRPAGD